MPPSFIKNGYIENLTLEIGLGFRVHCYDSFSHKDGSKFKDYNCTGHRHWIEIEECTGEQKLLTLLLLLRNFPHIN